MSVQSKVTSLIERLNPLSTEVEYENIVPTLRNEIRFAHFNERVPIYKLAKAMKCSPNTVSKMMHGETRYPRYATVAMMLHYFGYKLYARRG
jgi:transcriptional antiterminator